MKQQAYETLLGLMLNEFRRHDTSDEECINTLDPLFTKAEILLRRGDKDRKASVIRELVNQRVGSNGAVARDPELTSPYGDNNPPVR